MIHYTTHNGSLHHFMHGSGIEEQATDDTSYFVAVSPRAFEDGKIVCASRHKPGVARVLLQHDNNCQMVFSRDEFLPAGTVVV